MNTIDHRALVAQGRFETPLGGMLAAATARGIAGLWFDGQRHHPGALDVPSDSTQRWIAQLREELWAYFRGASMRFATPLDLAGSDFQRSVWQALLSVPAGETPTYGALARSLGRADAVRAVAAAVGRNPVSIVVPCHRIVGQNGSLTGYAGGLDRKAALLRLEGARAGLQRPLELAA
ncbi:methylated-DNA--[protein]-cysteine S-methyltransferase [Caldimonas sp. KR1-144]|uniref:methylated-DNA--[protein]-cysteine S-methyltransferase n=1 Tax=Caldimonas sp. KR1-144 TaxID=3400911 RepID=UPI003BFB6CD5